MPLSKGLVYMNLINARQALEMRRASYGTSIMPLKKGTLYMSNHQSNRKLSIHYSPQALYTLIINPRCYHKLSESLPSFSPVFSPALRT
jgi:hypothetical protein